VDCNITAELCQRGARAPNYPAENRALITLTQALADLGAGAEGNASDILERLLESALELCHAESAGVSLLERDGGRERVRWVAVAGRWADYRGWAMPRQVSPCGTVFERNTPLLLTRPERQYQFLPGYPPVFEMLHAPFSCASEPVGSLWLVAHDEYHKFDAEDRRLLVSLSRFAAAAWQFLQERSHQARLRAALARKEAAAERLQQLSLTAMDSDLSSLSEQILEAAVVITGSDGASLHLSSGGEPDRALRLRSSRGFGAGTTASDQACAAAWRTQQRVVVADFQPGDGISPDERGGAMQATPLVSRAGSSLGTLSTYWRQPHPPAADYRCMDVLARLAADLIAQLTAGDGAAESEQRFRNLADTAPVMLCITGPDGHCSFLSRGWYEFTGQKPAEGVGFGWLEAVHPDERAATRAHYLTANARGQAFAREHRIRRADGEYVWMLCAGQPRRDSKGRFGGYMVAIVDVSARKRAEHKNELLLREISHRFNKALGRPFWCA